MQVFIKFFADLALNLLLMFQTFQHTLPLQTFHLTPLFLLYRPFLIFKIERPVLTADLRQNLSQKLQRHLAWKQMKEFSDAAEAQPFRRP